MSSERTMTSPTKIMFLACGSFSPPTPMHLRMFEIARDHYREREPHQVIGGIVSPVHDLYNKAGLVPAYHRCAMLKLALGTSNWIRMSNWECNEQDEWTRTRVSLQYHQNYINSVLNDENDIVNEKLPGWIPESVKKMKGCNVKIKLLCGADLLESFAIPGLWLDEDLNAILGEHGLVVITRSATNPEKFIFESDLLTKHRKNITIATNWVPNEVSSTMARRHLSRGLSVKYMLDDRVVDYIKQHNLYDTKTTDYTLTSTNENNRDFVTGSLSPTYINDNYIKRLNKNNNNNNNYNFELMDETDSLSKNKYFNSNEGINSNRNATETVTSNGDASDNTVKQLICNGRTRVIRRTDVNANINGGDVTSGCNIKGRPGQAVQIRTRVIEHNEVEDEEEVGQSKIRTKALKSGRNKHNLERKFEYLSDNQLNKFNDKVLHSNLSNYDDNDETDDTNDDELDDFNADDEEVNQMNNNSDVDGKFRLKSINTLSAECLPSTSDRKQNDLIQFVFTSHGIKIISDKEYVV